MRDARGPGVPPFRPVTAAGYAVDTAAVAHVLAGLGREFARPEVAEIAEFFAFSLRTL